jgi:hypothetical protein
LGDGCYVLTRLSRRLRDVALTRQGLNPAAKAGNALLERRLGDSQANRRGRRRRLIRVSAEGGPHFVQHQIAGHHLDLARHICRKERAGGAGRSR